MKEFMQSHQMGKLTNNKLIQSSDTTPMPVSKFGKTWADARAGKVTYQVAGSKYMGNGNYVGTTGNNRFNEKVEAITGFKL